MVNYNSAIALYGFQDIPLDLKVKANDLGINIIPITQIVNSTESELQVRRIVSYTSALVIIKADKELHTIVQFYFAANKKVYFITEEEKSEFLPNGAKILSNTNEVLNELLQETEKQIIECKIGKIELRFNSFGLTFLKTSQQELPTGNLSYQAQMVQNQLESYFDGKLQDFNLKVCLKGSDFQRKVWAELTKIPYGQTISYGDLANNLGDKNASRAVGLANSKNPIWIIIPCHRVLSKDGDLTGYAGGLKLKQLLLDLESKQMSLF